MSYAEANFQTVQQFYGFMGQGDLDAAVRLLADDVVMVECESLPYGGTYRTREGVKEAIQKVIGYWDEPNFELKHMVSNDQVVMTHGIFTAVGKPTGRRIEMPIAEVWYFESGEVKRIDPIYGDTALACSALAVDAEPAVVS